MRHEVLNLQSIYLLKMYRNPFTLFLIAGEARCCAILAILPFVTLLILPRMRHEVPSWWPRCAIPPFIFPFDCQVEARSAELVTQMRNPALYDLFDCRVRHMWSVKLVQAILLLYLFSCILPNLSAFPISFLPIGGSTPKRNFLFLSYILFYFGVLPNLYLIFRSCIPRTFSRIVTTPEYFRILLHRLLLCTTTDPVFC